MGEVKTMTRLYALGISMVMSSGCMMVPARYREPIRSYPTPAPKTVAIEGFNVGGFQPTGYTTSTSFGTASATGSGGYASGSYVGSGLAVHNDYVVTSEAEDFRTILAQTRRFRIVAPGAPADLVLVGQVHAGPDMSWHYAVQFLEGLTLTPLFGVPVPVRGSGSASANIYQRDNRELVSSVNTGMLYLTAWTTIYSSGHDRERGLAILRGMAMRDLADRLAQAVCAGRS